MQVFNKLALGSIFKNKQYDPCCDSPFGFELFTEDTETIDFSGAGTEESPLTADLKISGALGNALTIIPSDGVFAGGLILTAANNGLSMSVGDTVVLGQDVSEVGNPATLLSNREIPMGAFSVGFSGTSGKVGIGTTAPTTALHVNRSGTTVVSSIEPAGHVDGILVSGQPAASNTIEVGVIAAGNSAASTGAFRLARSRGTTAVPTDVVNGDQLGSLTASGYTNGSMLNTAAIFFQIDNTVGVGTLPTNMRFFTGTTSRTERMRITSAGLIGIGTSAPNASSLVDITSTTQGFLPPRMTTIQRDAISSPAAGLMIYNTTTNKLNVFTTAWEAVTSV